MEPEQGMELEKYFMVKNHSYREQGMELEGIQTPTEMAWNYGEEGTEGMKLVWREGMEKAWNQNPMEKRAGTTVQREGISNTPNSDAHTVSIASVQQHTCDGELKNCAQSLWPHCSAKSAGVKPSMSRTPLSIPLATKT